MTDSVLEIVNFAVNPQVDEARFIAAAQEANGVLSAMPGFLNRRLVKTGEGHWMDILEWTDRESADRAAGRFHLEPGAKAFCAMIDMSSVAMAHHAVAVSAG
jgi:Antibiotic biosynthesis monooxygenase